MATEAKEGPGVLTLALAYTASAIHAVWKAVTRDGTLAAAGRQGADELGAALKAFPESIQTQEVGSILNPTQGEIAAGRGAAGLPQPGRYPMRSPSDIARDKGPYGPDRDVGRDIGTPEKSPSEIARDKGPDRPEPGQQQEHDRGRA